MKEVLNWCITSELKNGKYKIILLIMSENKNTFGFEKYHLEDFMQKNKLKSVEEVINFMNKRKESKT